MPRRLSRFVLSSALGTVGFGTFRSTVATGGLAHKLGGCFTGSRATLSCVSSLRGVNVLPGGVRIMGDVASGGNGRIGTICRHSASAVRLGDSTVTNREICQIIGVVLRRDLRERLCAGCGARRTLTLIGPVCSGFGF